MEINTLTLVNFQEKSRRLTINALIKKCSHNPDKLTIHALYDGDIIEPWETVMTIEGDLADFSHLETVYLGCLSRQTKICTNKAVHMRTALFFTAGI